MRRLILRNFQSPGDIVMLTAAVRDLHRAYPGQFVTDVRTSCPELWWNNPYLTPLDDSDTSVEIVDCGYPLIHESNQAPWHFLHGFISFLNSRLSLAIRPTCFRGDIHLSIAEKRLPPHPAIGGRPYWLVAAGGKLDFTIKWWSTARYQRVLDSFRGRLTFVQAGAANHVHPALDGVVDLRGRTTLRDLIRLVYGAAGVLTPVSLLMHLAAAVEYPAGDPGSRPCVVIAGGREPPHWEAYPAHQFLHTIGMLPCCASGGCWKSRTRRLGDDAEHDQPANLCVDVAGDLPRCMDMIRPEQVIERIEAYLHNGAAVTAAADPVEPSVAAANRFLAGLPQDSLGGSGRGIVICGGGSKYFPSAWVAIRRLRDLGCDLPIELWHLGPGEVDSRMKQLLRREGVISVDAIELSHTHPMPRLNGWELKPFAMLHCSFEHVLLLDADNICYRNPEFLFEAPEYSRTGAIFWPDLDWLGPDRTAWKVFGVAHRHEPSFESGQIVLNKTLCAKPLQLTVWYNRHSKFFYDHVYGDKETFHMAFRRLDAPYTMPARIPERTHGIFTQFDLEGAPLFQHGIKWKLAASNLPYASLPFFDECQQYLAELRREWDGIIDPPPPKPLLRPAWSFGARPLGTGETARSRFVPARIRIGTL